MENNKDILLWPPLVIIHFACTRKIKDGHLEGIGNQEMDEQLKVCKATQSSSYLVSFSISIYDSLNIFFLYTRQHSVHGSYPTI